MDSEFLSPFTQPILLKPYMGPYLRSPEEQLWRQLKKVSHPIRKQTKRLLESLKINVLASQATQKTQREGSDDGGAGQRQSKKLKVNLGEVDMVRL
jgi:hypothetical protein